jgi:hypothetical protein
MNPAKAFSANLSLLLCLFPTKTAKYQKETTNDEAIASCLCFFINTFYFKDANRYEYIM